MLTCTFLVLFLFPLTPPYTHMHLTSISLLSHFHLTLSNSFPLPLSLPPCRPGKGGGANGGGGGGDDDSDDGDPESDGRKKQLEGATDVVVVFLE